MNSKKKKLLAKIAYLYYVEGQTQGEISKSLGIYRTTISRMLTQAREEGLVTIEIKGFDSDLFALEEHFRKKYNLLQVEIASCHQSASEDEKADVLAVTAAAFVRSIINSNQSIGISWGSTLSRMIDKLENRYTENCRFHPLAGGPSHINSKYHVNTLVYEMARKLNGKSSFINATVIQESTKLTKGIINSKYFESTLASWDNLDVAIVGVGGHLEHNNSQWRDLLSNEDYTILKAEGAIGESVCRFFNQNGQLVHQQLQDRTIGIPLEKISQIERSVAIARGRHKAQALLALMRQQYVNSIVTDRETAIEILQLDGDATFQ